jgi:hypothetical protein
LQAQQHLSEGLSTQSTIATSATTAAHFSASRQNSENFLIFARQSRQDCYCPCDLYRAGQQHKDKFNKWRKSWQQEPNPHLVRTVAEALAKFLSQKSDQNGYSNTLG